MLPGGHAEGLELVVWGVCRRGPDCLAGWWTDAGETEVPYTT